MSGLTFLDTGSSFAVEETRMILPDQNGAGWAGFGVGSRILKAGGTSSVIDVSTVQSVLLWFSFLGGGAAAANLTDNIIVYWCAPGGDINSGSGIVDYDIIAVPALTFPATAQWPLILPVRGTGMQIVNGTFNLGGADLDVRAFGSRRPASLQAASRSGVVWDGCKTYAAAEMNAVMMQGPYRGPVSVLVGTGSGANTARILVDQAGPIGTSMVYANNGNAGPNSSVFTSSLPLMWGRIRGENLTAGALTIHAQIIANPLGF